MTIFYKKKKNYQINNITVFINLSRQDILNMYRYGEIKILFLFDLVFERIDKYFEGEMENCRIEVI